MKGSHLLQHRQRYWYDRSIPRHLQASMGRTRFRINLTTSDLKEALKRLPECEALFALTIAKVERQVKGTLDPVERVEELALALRESNMTADEDGPYVSVDSEEGKAVEQTVDVHLRDYFADVVMGRTPKRMKVFIEEYLASETHLAPRTLLERKTILHKLAQWSASKGVLNVLKFKRDHAKAFVTTLKGEPATVAKAIQGPLALWKHMKEDGVAVDPAIWAGLAPKKTRHDKNEDKERGFRLAELRVLLNAPVRKDLKDSMLIALYTGMRLAEVGYLRVEHIDLHNQTIRVPGTKNANALRIIPMHPKLIDLMKERMEGKAAKDFILHELGSENLKHGRKRSAKVSQAFTRFRESLGITEDREGKRRSLVTFHSFRHTADTAMMQHNPPIAPHVIDAFFGWSDQGKMRSRYAVSADLMAGMREALKALEWDL